MPQIGPMELIIILAILLLLFGAKKLPELARSIGTSAGELRKGMSGDTSDKDNSKSAKTDVDKKAQ